MARGQRVACGELPMTPACFNREPFTAYTHQSGEVIPHRMSQPCRTWATGDRATPVPVLQGWNCAGCKWLPREDVMRFAQMTTNQALVSALAELAA